MANKQNSELGAITTLAASWEGHTHYEVEQFIKDQLEQLGSTTVRSKINVAINGNSIRNFLDGSSDETFNYTVTYTKDNMTQTSCKVKITVDKVVAFDGDSVAGTPVTSLNIAEYLDANKSDTVYVTVKCYDVDEYNNETVSSSARLTYNRKKATLICTTAFGSINPSIINYTTDFTSGNTAVLFTEYYNEDGTELQTTVKKTLTVRGSTSTSVPTSIKDGAHIVKSYLVLQDDNDSDEKTGTTGETVSVTIVISSAASSKTYLLVSPVDNAVINNYVDIQFTAYNSGSVLSIPIVMQEYVDGYTTVATRNIANGSNQTWHYLVRQSSCSLRFIIPDVDSDGNIIYKADGTVQFTTHEPVILNFTATTGSVSWETPLGTSAYFSMVGKSNDDADIGILKSGEYSATFEDVQFNTNGSGYNDIVLDGYTTTALHLVGTSRFTLGNLYPFYDTTAIGSFRGGGILATGRTLKISFMVSNVSNADEKIISCWDGNTGFYITGDSMYIKIGKELISLPEESQFKTGHNTRKFSSDTKIDLTITVQPYYDNGKETKHELRYYINGEIAGFDVLKNSEIDLQTLSQSSPTTVTFGGNGAVLDIFDVRYYERALSAFEVLQMRTMDLDSSNTIKDIFEKNNYYDVDSDGEPVITLAQAIKYGKYSKNPKFAVWACTNLCNTSEYIGNTSTHSSKPEHFYLFKFTDTGTIDAEHTIFVESCGIDTAKSESYLRVRRQGTSTASSTKGNIRVDIRNTCIIHKWNSETETFYEYSGTDDEHCYTVKKGATIWQIPDSSAIPCSLLTCKKNPNESTQARNLPTAKWYEDMCRYMATVTGTDADGKTIYPYEDCLTKPQQKELQSIIANRTDTNSRKEQVDAIKTRQCVDGIPSLGFEVAYPDDSSKCSPLSLSNTFGGQFDLITDKTNEKVFGFGGYHRHDSNTQTTWVTNESSGTNRDYSIEWRRNASPICNFLQADLSLLNDTNTADNPNEMASDLEYRYPDLGNAVSETNTVGKTYTLGMGKQEGIQRLFDLVRTCALDKEDYNDAGYYYSAGVKTAYNKTGYIPIGEKVLGEANANESAYTWKADTKTNRIEKFKAEAQYYIVVNQMLVNGIAILAGLMCDQDTKNQFFTHFTDEENEGHDLLRLLGYDFDSSWGIDNDNYFRFLPTVLYSDDLYDGRALDSKGVYKGPMFWKIMFEAYATELSTIAGHLYSGFLHPDIIMDYMHTNQVNVYNAIQYNANSEYSYTEKASDYQKTHGSAKEHNEWFVNGRMEFLSGRWGKGTSNEPGGVYTNGVANFNLALLNDEFKTKYPNNASQRGKNKWAISVTGYQRTTVQLREGASTYYPKVDVDVVTTYDSDYKPISVSRPVATAYASESTGSSAGDNRIAIYGGKYLKTITGLANWYISSVMDWGDLTNIEELNIGSTENLGTNTNPEYYRNPNLTNLSISSSFGSCKKFNLAGCVNLSGSLSLMAFPVLEEFEGIRMDSVTDIVLPISNSLRKISYPKNMTSWSVSNKPNLTSVSFEGTSLIEYISVTNSSDYVAKLSIDILEKLI